MRTLTNILIIAFLAVQLLLPLRGFIHNPFETRARFSWNMYAKKHEVKVFYYYLTPRGDRVPINYKTHFNNPARATLVHHRDTLPEFHAYLCDVIKQLDQRNQLFGEVISRVNEGEEVELVTHRLDLCSAPNYGVNLR